MKYSSKIQKQKTLLNKKVKIKWKTVMLKIIFIYENYQQTHQSKTFKLLTVISTKILKAITFNKNVFKINPSRKKSHISNNQSKAKFLKVKFIKITKEN